MSKRALVLGGGGTVGIAWETGVLAGLGRAGVPVGAADLVIGTSAGAVVGTQLALGMDLETLLAAQLAPPEPREAAPSTVDPRSFGGAMQLLGQAAEVSPAVLAAVGRLALAASTVDEVAYLQRFALLADQPWPARALRITAVDAQTGSFHAWGADDGVPLHLAVAANCAVPGLFPPVTIAGRRYMDGGMRSDTSADLAAGYDQVLVVAPIGPSGLGGGLAAQRPLLREVTQLRAAGTTLELVVPDEGALAAFGLNLMDPGRRGGAAEAGLRQGQAVSAQVGHLWAA